MARGTVINEPIVSQASNEAFRANYDRSGLGLSETAKERGRFVWDPERRCLVRAENYNPPARAIDAPIMVDRFYEGAKSTDGVDIGSRAKHRAYMKERGLAPAGDYSESWYAGRRAEMKREADKQRHEVVDRAFHDIAEGKVKRTRHG